MIYPSGDKLEESVESKYTLVVLAAKRAKQLREGAPKLIETESTNPLTVALEEIAAGKVKAKLPTEGELMAIETKRRAAWETFEPEAIAAQKAAVEEAAPSVQELLRVEGEEPEPEPVAEEAVPQASVADLLKIEGVEEKEPAEEEEVAAESVADLLKIEGVEEEPLTEDAAAEPEEAEAVDETVDEAVEPEVTEAGLTEE